MQINSQHHYCDTPKVTPPDVTEPDSLGNKYPKIQILTVEEIFRGKKPDIPQLVRLVEKRKLKKSEKTNQIKL